MKQLIATLAIVLLCATAFSQTAPLAVSDAYTTCPNTIITAFVLVNDSDAEGDSIFVSAIAIPASQGATTLSGNEISFAPNTDFAGSDSFSYQLCDTTGLCSIGWVYVTVDSCLTPNTAPTATADADVICNGSNLLLYVLANDIDAEGDSLHLDTLLVGPYHGTAIVTAAQIIYSPAPGYFGFDTFTYTVCDQHFGNPLCATGTVVIEVQNCTPPNQPPTAQPDIYVMFEDITLPLIPSPLSNDADPENSPLVFSLIFGPLNGVLTQNGNTFTYNPDQDYNGIDGFIYQVCDTNNPPACTFSVGIITVQNTNDRPNAVNDTFIILEDQSISLPVASNDVDIDGDPLFVSQINPAPTHGTAVAQGTSIMYTPAPNYNGTDWLKYRICDSVGFFQLCDTARVFIIIQPVNDPPIATDDTGYYAIDEFETPNLLLNDTDLEGDSLHLTALYPLDPNLSATIVFDSTGEYSFSGIACGQNIFTYIVCDPSNACDTGQLFFNNICDPNDPNYFLAQGISPDSDGLNDVLRFDLGSSTGHLRIFNRYGAIIYENEDYQNDWGGTYLENGKPVPDGTYFYILELTCTSCPKPSTARKMNYVVVQR